MNILSVSCYSGLLQTKEFKRSKWFLREVCPLHLHCGMEIFDYPFMRHAQTPTTSRNELTSRYELALVNVSLSQLIGGERARMASASNGGLPRARPP